MVVVADSGVRFLQVWHCCREEHDPEGDTCCAGEDSDGAVSVAWIVSSGVGAAGRQACAEGGGSEEDAESEHPERQDREGAEHH